MHRPRATHGGSAYGSWYFLACLLAGIFIKGEKKINPCFCAFVQRCEDLLCVQKNRVRERESCGITTNRHLKFSVESKIPYMVPAIRYGIFNVWQMYQHTVRKYLLLKEKHFVGYIFPSVALVDLDACTLSWPACIFHGELNVDPCGILPIYSDICSLTNETLWDSGQFRRGDTKKRNV